MKEGGLFINGKWIRGGARLEVRSPYDRSLVGVLPSATPQMVDAAIASAYEAREEIAALPLHRRAAILEKTAGLIEERREAFTRTICLEAGKAWKFSAGEVARAIGTFRFAAVEAMELRGDTVPMGAAAGAENRVAFYERFPIGVVGAITPFNFPLNLVAHKVAPAIASGNPVILKPASSTPLTSVLLVEALLAAGLPSRGIQLLAGSGAVVGDAMVTDDRLAMITFTGSPPVGWRIKERCGRKRTTLELGSNSAILVDEDADVDAAVPKCVTAAFAYAGQVCISLQRMFVHEKIAAAFQRKFVAATRALKAGDPLSPDTDLNPMITEDEAKRAEEWIREAQSEGARVLCGGKRKGRFVEATVLARVKPSMRVSCLETFAPVVTITPFKTFEEGLRMVNDSIYGLQAGVFTRDIRKAFQAFRTLDVGGVIINDPPTFRADNMPYGGVKNSGLGREGVKFAVQEMTELRLMVVNV